MMGVTLQRDWERDPSRSLLLLSLTGGAAVTGRGPRVRVHYGPATVSAMKSHSPWSWRRESWVKSM